MRKIITVAAKMPSGCICNDAFTLPCRRYEIERPNPQPGQRRKPARLNMHSEKWLPESGLVAANANRLASQNSASQSILRIMAILNYATLSLVRTTERSSVTHPECRWRSVGTPRAVQACAAQACY